MARARPMMLRHEEAYWASAPSGVLAGVDEAGRGCLAGPVYAGAVSIPRAALAALYEGPLAGLTDSKQLTAKQRERYFEALTHLESVSWGVGTASAAEIDSINILRATHLAMRRAVEALGFLPDRVIVDGLPVKGLPCPSTAIVKGDASSLLIAAASVIAKVSRDHFMVALDKRYPAYGFAVHKGYCVPMHLAALAKFGPCPEHRHSFRPVQDVENRLPGL
jgi:ribonuclease HII